MNKTLLSDKMYEINRGLSIMLLQNLHLTKKEMIELNLRIGEWIKEVRNLEEKHGLY